MDKKQDNKRALVEGKSKSRGRGMSNHVGKARRHDRDNRECLEHEQESVRLGRARKKLDELCKKGNTEEADSIVACYLLKPPLTPVALTLLLYPGFCSIYVMLPMDRSAQ